jgi:hypothetical protein
MSDDFELPPDLDRLEQALIAISREEPSGQLKEKCLRSLHAEAKRQQSGSRWAFAIAFAASVFVGFNLSMSATQATDCGFRLDGRQQSVAKTAAEIRRLLPDVSPREAARQALLLHASAAIVPCPNVAGGRDLLDERRKLAKSDL